MVDPYVITEGNPVKKLIVFHPSNDQLVIPVCNLGLGQTIDCIQE